MGRGLGPAQRAILDSLGDDALTTEELAEQLGRSARQIRTAVDALEGRGLVVVQRRQIGWKGRGEYGDLTDFTAGDYAAGMDPEPGTEWWQHHPYGEFPATVRATGERVVQVVGESYRRMGKIRAGVPVYGRVVRSADGYRRALLKRRNPPAWALDAAKFGQS